MIWIASIGLVACLVTLVVHYWREFSETAVEYSRPWLMSWIWRGVATPIFIWMVLNIGKTAMMPPLTHHIGMIRGKGLWVEMLAGQTCIAALVTASCWAALTFGWFVVNLFRRARNTDELVIATFVWGPMLLLLMWVFGYFFGWAGGGFGMVLWLWPLTHHILNVAQVKQPPPTYSRAIAKMKFGKYAEAEMAIIGQLEKSETDFDGWMMLADLYAHQFHDLAEAERTICELCDEPTTTPSQVSVALHRLADWQLKLRNDPGAARRVLEEIGKRMPGTHLAVMAQNRINQLPASAKDLKEQQKPKTVTMPDWKTNLDEPVKLDASPANREQAMTAANQLVAQLQQDPNDIAAREKLARVLAEQLGKIDMAVEQLELLIGMPEQAAAKSAEWLGLMAGWQIENGGEGERAQETLERLIRDFPQSPHAFAAQRRLSMMRVRKPRLRRVPEGDDEA